MKTNGAKSLEDHSARRNWQRAWDLFTQPSAGLRDPAARRNAKLLSTFLLCLFLLFLAINLGYAIGSPSYRIPPADLIGYALLLTAYALSRTHLVHVATIILLVMFPLNVFANVINGTSISLPNTLSYLIPGYILASILIPVGWLIFYGMVINLLVVLLPVLAPETVHGLADVTGSLAVGLVTIALVVIAVLHRNQIEDDRQAEMKQIYDNTLVGWAQALEYRDKETREHSKRVTDLTLLLARTLKIKEGELEHIRRGALLHDVGKMAIPDAILQKPGELDAQEWSVMRTHPTVAFEMLKEIPFLKPALDIPYCHHEWWDGSGYPRGLSGENIPQTARIFAVVDVWDALLDDRPYREAWQKETVKEYMRQLSGRQFDPRVLAIFMEMVEQIPLAQPPIE